MLADQANVVLPSRVKKIAYEIFKKYSSAFGRSDLPNVDEYFLKIYLDTRILYTRFHGIHNIPNYVR